MDENQILQLTSTPGQNYGVEIVSGQSSPSSAVEQEVNKSEVEPDQVTNELPENSDNGNVSENGSAVAVGDQDEQSSAKKDKRKVSFPVDAGIIKGYLDPPDPWKEGIYNFKLLFHKKVYAFMADY